MLPVLDVGTHEIVAVYSGDVNFLASTSDPLLQVVNPADTTIEVSSSNPVAVEEEPITLTATVSIVPPGAGTPSGFVTFLDNFNGETTVLSVVALGDSAAIGPLEVGTHLITAEFTSDSPNFSGSISDTFVQEVLPAGPTFTTFQAASASDAVFLLGRSRTAGGRCLLR